MNFFHDRHKFLFQLAHRQRLSQEIVALSDAVVHLPMYGMVNSLNVSTVTAVLMYHLVGRLDQ